MVKILAGLILFISSSFCSKKEWSAAQWKAAGTADDQSGLSKEEKEIVRYVNLARLYPDDFAEIEVKPYEGIPARGYDLKSSRYKSSLLKTLDTMRAANAVLPDTALGKNARCFAEETGAKGLSGHTRDKCPEAKASECVSYARDNGREIVLQLLIDHQVASLGHRRICLDRRYSRIGCAMAPHSKYDECAVLQFR